MGKTTDNLQVIVSREQLNAIIALLVVLVGKSGAEELLKKRRANKGLVQYFGDKLGISNKDLANIFNTRENSISNLKSTKKRKKKIKNINI